MIASFPALRFFNALLIFCHHKNAVSNPILEAFGPCAVSFFLMLSGFVMCCGYKEKVLAPTFGYKRFLYKRFARLYPLHLFCLVLWLGLNCKSIVSWGGVQIFSIICNLFLVQSWVPDGTVYFSGNAVSWCLSDLFFFYAVFPFVIRLIQKRGCALAFTVAYFCAYAITLSCIPESYIHAFAYINPLFRFADFYIGILLYVLYAAKRSGVENKSAAGLCVQVLSVLVTLLAIYAYRFLPNRLRYSVLFFVPSALMIVAFSLFENTQATRVLGSRLFIYLGEISFTFYMLHTLGISSTNAVFGKCELELNFALKAIVQCAFVLLGSIMVHRFFEKPVLEKLQRVFWDKANDSRII